MIQNMTDKELAIWDAVVLGTFDPDKADAIISRRRMRQGKAPLELVSFVCEGFDDRVRAIVTDMMRKLSEDSPQPA